MFQRLSHGARAVLAQAEREARGLSHPFVGTEHLLLAMLATQQFPAADAAVRPPAAVTEASRPQSGAVEVPHEPGVGAFAMLTSVGLGYDLVREDVVRLGTRGEGLGPADADALQAIGIDIEVVRARVEEMFGVGALDPPLPPRRHGVLGLRRRLRAPEGPTGRRLFTARMRRVIQFCVREAEKREYRLITTELLLLGIIREGRGLAARVLTGRGVDLVDLGARIESTLVPPRERHGTGHKSP
jgi:hypothetical protein